MKKLNRINEYLGLLKETIDKVDHSEIMKVVESLQNAKNSNKKIIIFGNGGSAATASHFACDINKGVSYGESVRYKVLALTDNIATILAYANDVSYEDIFLEQLKNFIEEGDVVIGISGSGNSKNVLKAIEYANLNGNETIGITGYNGGKLKKMAKKNLNAPVDDMQISEDLHMVFVHLVMKILIDRL